MIDEIIKQLKPLINGKLIYLSQYGSHLYGLNTENSDLDFRGVYIPELDDIILHKDKDEINEELEIYLPPEPLQQKEHVLGEIYMQPIVSERGKQVNANRDNLKKVDVKIFSLQKFIQLCSKADTNALDLLFSYPSDNIEQYVYAQNMGRGKWNPHEDHYFCPFGFIHRNRNKLINTDRLESPITYAFKQATKYGLKGERLKVLEEVLQVARDLIEKYQVQNELNNNGTAVAYIPNVKELVKELEPLDGKHLRIDVLDNKGKKEKYLFVCGVQHQFNLDLDKFIKRIEEKINKEYTSQRTIDAKDGNDWKALSHAIRVLLEIKELLDTGNIQFPLKDKDFLLDIKLGKVEREYIDNFFNQELSNILERVQKNELDWKYDEEFWNEFILNEVKHV